MPMFAYRCDTCGRTEDKLQKSDAPEQHLCGCVEMGLMNRQIAAANFTLKGGGWYKPGPSPR